MKNNFNKISPSTISDMRMQKCSYRHTCTVQDHSCPKDRPHDRCYRQWCDPNLDTLPVQSSDDYFCPLKELDQDERNYLDEEEEEASDFFSALRGESFERGRDKLIKRMQDWQRLNMVVLILSLFFAPAAFFLEWYLTSIDMLTPGKETVIGFCVMISEDFPQFLIASFFFRTFKKFSCQHNLNPDLKIYINSAIMSIIGASKMSILHIIDSFRHRRPLKYLMIIGS